MSRPILARARGRADRRRTGGAEGRSYNGGSIMTARRLGCYCQLTTLRGVGVSRGYLPSRLNQFAIGDAMEPQDQGILLVENSTSRNWLVTV